MALRSRGVRKGVGVSVYQLSESKASAVGDIRTDETVTEPVLPACRCHSRAFERCASGDGLTIEYVVDIREGILRFQSD
jgi:hypothetical protein